MRIALGYRNGTKRTFKCTWKWIFCQTCALGFLKSLFIEEIWSVGTAEREWERKESSWVESHWNTRRVKCNCSSWTWFIYKLQFIYLVNLKRWFRIFVCSAAHSIHCTEIGFESLEYFMNDKITINRWHNRNRDMQLNKCMKFSLSAFGQWQNSLRWTKIPWHASNSN